MLLLSRTDGEVIDFYDRAGEHNTSIKFGVVRDSQSKDVKVTLQSVESVDGEGSEIVINDELLIEEWYELSPSISIRLHKVDAFMPRVSICFDLDKSVKVVRREIIEEIGVSNWDFAR